MTSGCDSVTGFGKGTPFNHYAYHWAKCPMKWLLKVPKEFDERAVQFKDASWFYSKCSWLNKSDLVDHDGGLITKTKHCLRSNTTPWSSQGSGTYIQSLIAKSKLAYLSVCTSDIHMKQKVLRIHSWVTLDLIENIHIWETDSLTWHSSQTSFMSAHVIQNEYRIILSHPPDEKGSPLSLPDPW